MSCEARRPARPDGVIGCGHLGPLSRYHLHVHHDDPRLDDIAALSRQRRKAVRHSQESLARESGAGARSIRRLEGAQRVDPLTYDLVGRALLLPREWYLYPERYLGPDRTLDADAFAKARELAAERFLRAAEDTGVLGREEVEMLRAFVELHLRAGRPGFHGRLTSDMHRLVLETASAQRLAPASRPSR